MLRFAIFLLKVTLLSLSCLVMSVQADDAARPVLRVLAWPGYADADVVAAFEREHDVHVELSVVTSDETLWRKVSMLQAADFDVFAVNTAELQRYINRQLVLPIDVAAIPNMQRQLPRFREHAAIPGLMRDGNLYAVPYTWAEMGLIYDRSQFTTPPDSISVLWDPRFRGRVLVYNGGVHAFTLAAQHLDNSTPFSLHEADWPATVDSLIALRRNVLAFYAQPQESVELFRKHQAAVLFANYGSQQLRLLKAAGVDAGYMIPAEGALAWLDCWVIATGVQNRVLANAWIDYMLRPEVSHLLVSRQGLASTLEESVQPGSGRLIWLQPVENVERRNLLWTRILSGDRAAQVLPPNDLQPQLRPPQGQQP